VSDFCLSQRALDHIARQAGLMDQMVPRAGIGPSRAARSADPALWYEARLKCIGCAMIEQCTQFLASPKAAGQTQVPSFCANRTFFGDRGPRVGNFELGERNGDSASIGSPHARA
jgi:Family of unknown function (DUF6455)